MKTNKKKGERGENQTAKTTKNLQRERERGERERERERGEREREDEKH